MTFAKMIDIPKTKKDFDIISHIHKIELHDTGFLSECSERFISFFYEKISIYSSSILLIVRNSKGEIVGFTFCTKDKDEYYKRYFNENLNSLLRYPSTCLPLIRGLAKRMNQELLIQYNCELVQIAVDHLHRGKGYAQQMIRFLEDELKKNGVNELYLQVLNDNENAIDLYKRNKFEVAHIISAGKRNKLIMVKKFIQ